MKKNVGNKRDYVSSIGSYNSSTINIGRNNNHVYNGRQQYLQKSARSKK